MTKAVAIWLAVLTILYVVNLTSDLIRERHIRNLEARLRKLEGED